jgi:hypothetical protein
VLGGATIAVVLLYLSRSLPKERALKELLSPDGMTIMAVMFVVPTVIGAVGCCLGLGSSAAIRRLLHASPANAPQPQGGTPLDGSDHGTMGE